MKNSLKNLSNAVMSEMKSVKLRAAAKKASNARVAAANKAVLNFKAIAARYIKNNTSVKNAALNAARKKAQAAVNAV
jgi:hypothetical protein